MGGVILTKCSNCKKENEAAVAYAAEEIMPLANDYHITFTQSNNFEFSYIFDKNYAEIVVRDIPINSNITFELIAITDIKNKINFNPVCIVAYWGARTNFINQGNGRYYCNLITTSSEYQIVIDFNKLVTEKLEVNFALYSYYGSYVPGYGQGLAAGLQQGYNQGVNDSQYGAFKGATVDITQDFDGKKPNQTFKNLIPNYVYQGINSLNLDGYYDDPLELEDLYKCTFTINFAEPWTYDQNKNRLFFSGDLIGLTEYVTITTPDNVYYSFDITYEPQRGAVLNDKINPILISEIEFTVGRPSDLGRWWLTSVNTGTADYNYGYNQGYDAGLTAGKGNGYDAGYNTGFKEGESQGYANAVSEGASAMGLFTGAVSFVKVFFQLLTKLLETKIAGDISMGLLVVGLPAAFMIVNLAIGLVKKLLGARGASEGGDDS